MKSLLLLLISFVAITAFVSGILILIDPDGGVMSLSTGLLKTGPFKNFLVPGIALTVLVGGTNMVAVAKYVNGHGGYYNWAIAGGIMIVGFIIVELMVIQTFSWLQTLYLTAGILIILLALRLK